MEKNKKAIVGLIFAITTVLAALSLYVSWELRRDLSPDDTSADTTTTTIPTDIAPTKTTPTKVTPSKVAPSKVTPSKVIATTRPTSPGTLATPQPSRPLPSTALVNDRVDAAIMGSLMVFVGIFLYKKYLNFGYRKES